MGDITGWFTINGHHIPIKAGQTKQEAASNFINHAQHSKASHAGVPKKVKQKAAIKEKEDFVKKSMSNTAKPFKREEKVNLNEVKSRGGVSDNVAKIAAGHADRIYSKASKEEPKITSDIIESVKTVNGTMYGLDFRLKQPTSMAGKIASDSRTDRVSLAKASSSIKDAIRYTAILNENNFSSGYSSMKKSLEAKGYTELRCKNFYTMYKNGKSQQKAVQCVFKNSNGQTFELQFHTVKSQGVKELLHPLYEEYRKGTTSNSRKIELDATMKELSSNVTDPKGVFNIINY